VLVAHVTQTVGPWETHPDARASEGRQRYFGGDAVNFSARQTFGPFPVIVEGFRLDVERSQWLTLYKSAWVGVGGAGAFRVGFRLYDVDNVTAIVDSFDTLVMTPLAAGPGVWSVSDWTLAAPPPIGTNPRQVRRVVSVIFEITDLGGLVQALASARLFVSFRRRSGGD
jgi:hypothetical protein